MGSNYRQKIHEATILTFEFINSTASGKTAKDYWIELSTIFDYAEGFKERVCRYYDMTYGQLKKETDLNQWKYLHLMLFRRKIKEKISKEFESIGIVILTYNKEKDSLIVSSLESYEEFRAQTDCYNDDGFLNFILAKGYIFELSSVPDEAWEKMKPNTRSRAIRLLKVSRTLSILRSKIPDKNNSRMINLIGDFEGMLCAHQRIKEIRKKFRRILEEITNGVELDSIKGLNLCIRLYKENAQQVIIDDSSRIEVLNAFKGFFYSSPSPQNLQKVFCWFLIEYIRIFGVKRIRQCPYCKKFFIAKHSSRRRCYSNDCEKRYQRLKKRKQRELEPEIYS